MCKLSLFNILLFNSSSLLNGDIFLMLFYCWLLDMTLLNPIEDGELFLNLGLGILLFILLAFSPLGVFL